MNTTHLEQLLHFVFQSMHEASNEEVRVTVYLLTLFLLTDTTECWVYLDELIDGRDNVNNLGFRSQLLQGVGLSKAKLLKAIKAVNTRGICAIEHQKDYQFLLKVTLLKTATAHDYKKHL